MRKVWIYIKGKKDIQCYFYGPQDGKQAGKQAGRQAASLCVWVIKYSGEGNLRVDNSIYISLMLCSIFSPKTNMWFSAQFRMAFIVPRRFSVSRKGVRSACCPQRRVWITALVPPSLWLPASRPWGTTLFRSGRVWQAMRRPAQRDGHGWK